MSFQQGLSGLGAASKQLDVIGNNVANASTVGFKRARAEFSDLYAASMYGVSATATGIGSRTVAVTQQFNQGPVTSTGNPMDMAITGQGFFRMQGADGQAMYTRNGEFQLDREGYFVNAGHYLTGYGVDDKGQVVAGPPQPLRVDTSNIGAKATSSMILGSNLDARAEPPAKAFPNVTPGSNTPDPNSYNYTNTVTAYDSLGVSHQVSFYYVRRPDAAPVPPATEGVKSLEWDVYSSVDGGAIATAAPVPPATVGAPVAATTLQFDSTGKIVAPNGKFTLSQAVTSGGAPLNIAVEMTGFTQNAGPYANAEQRVDGWADGVLSSVGTSKEGFIEARYSNGQTKIVGQVVLANFANAQGLQPIGDNRWVETYASGGAKINTPGSSNVGYVQGAALEDSNVDMTTELVNMITAQRFYQANAQTIKTQDTVLQTLINLR
ncbi:flagellar hook protein FlgE [Craterilacuibacter sinensis]|uniref:Flagellar hook protein FlgE n=1 Tax=Craterilacuibacter sinensis TaxID=2686017 RepID=A0A845BKS5_9NEIS|nr:flagellar hook protein FlgE [Craterilacuibacter sinensis]MXR36819.1 flagellar hook-basal body complex protein [Craterilacuibacter sinensis]